MTRWTFTSESVSEGHPDKMADQISDAILDEMLAQDPMSRVACETLVTTGLAVIAGEITTEAYVDIPGTVRRTINEIGYDNEAFGYDGNTCGVMVTLDEQSPDISQGVTASEEVRSGAAGEEDELDKQGAGDQGMMFGYACDETDVLMPLPIHLAHRMAEKHAEVRKAGTIPYLRPDAKTQVTFEYEDNRPVKLKTVLVSTQHNDGIDRDSMIRPDLIEHVIRPVIPEQFADDDYDVHVNPTGRFVIGGPVGDAGLTGRKIIVDTYGGMARHGGGAFSGKDPSKVDRSAAYATRWVAKNLVAAGAASRCEIQVAYAIGMARPMSVLVETFGTETVEKAAIEKAVDEVFDLRPGAILRDLDLRRPIYRRSAAYGHFGREATDGLFPWEKTRSRRRREVGAGPLSDPDQGRLELGEGGPPAGSDRIGETSRPAGRVVRVLPDVVGIDREFDYVVPLRGPRTVGPIGSTSARWSESPVGSASRRLGHRSRCRADCPGVRLVPLAKLSGTGPSRELIDLAAWAAWRWAGRRVPFLRGRVTGADGCRSSSSPPAADGSVRPARRLRRGVRARRRHCSGRPGRRWLRRCARGVSARRCARSSPLMPAGPVTWP